MRVAQWARLQKPARCGLRWGAWYPVMVLTPREAQLWVRGRGIAVARSLLELRSTPPREWTVARTASASDPYLVCPACRHRARLPDSHVATLRCPRCNDLFAIAWDDAPVEPSRDQLKSDHRMTRRRMSGDRRTGDDRRDTEHRVAERRVQVDRRRGVERRRRATS